MGYYMGGDRDDAGNYAPHLKTKVGAAASVGQLNDVSQHLGIEKGVEIPLEFDPDYYKRKQGKYGVYSPDYWEWDKLRRYSKAVYSFYRQAIAQFYSKFPLTTTPTRFEEAALNLKQEDLNELAAALVQAESELMRQFDSDGRTVMAKINKHSALMRVRECAARAWVIYGALNKKFFVGDALNFRKSYEGLDLTQDLSLLKVLRGCVIMRYNLQGVNEDAISKKLSRPNEIYEGVNAVDILNDLLAKIGAFQTTDYYGLLSNEEVQNLKLHYPALTRIYLNYNYIKYFAKSITKKAQSYHKSGAICNFAEEIGGENVDIYAEANKFLNEIKILLSKSLDPVFERDLSLLSAELETALNSAAPAYNNE